MRRSARNGAIAWLALTGVMSAAAYAQTGASDLGSRPRLVLGPLTLAPLVSAATLVDTNVFNDSEAPKQDVVVRVVPQAQGQLSLGRVQVQFLGVVNASRFQRYRDQGSLDVTTSARLDLDLSWLAPYATASLIRTRERPGLDIDIRPQRLNRTVSAGTAINLGAKTALVLGAFREILQYDENAIFLDQSLRESLERTREGANLALKRELTPITSVALTVEGDFERFAFTPSRNARSVRVLPSLEFSPGGLIDGRAAVGYRRLRPVDASVPPFAGIAALAELTYVLREATQFSVRVNRDVTFSYNPAEPYYLLTAVDVAVTRYISDRLRVTGSVGRRRLQFRTLEAAAQSPGRREDGLSAGVSIMYVTSRDVSFGVTVDRMERSGGTVLPGYQGLRTGVVVNYGQ